LDTEDGFETVNSGFGASGNMALRTGTVKAGTTCPFSLAATGVAGPAGLDWH